MYDIGYDGLITIMFAVFTIFFVSICVVSIYQVHAADDFCKSKGYDTYDKVDYEWYCINVVDGFKEYSLPVEVNIWG